MAEPNKMLEETANYLLNHCFVLGGVEDQRAKYLYVQDHLPEVRAVFAPLGYAVTLYPAPLQAAALVNEHEGSQARLLKYESILLLVLRLLYLQKRESLAASADQVLVTVEEVQTELQKMNLPRRLDQRTLEELMRTLRRYNLARPVGRLTGLDSLFAAVYSVENLNFQPKPMLAAYRNLLRVERLSPRRCIMVEDSLANLVTAKTLGMKTVWVSTGLRDSPSVDVKVRSVRELPRHLNRL